MKRILWLMLAVLMLCGCSGTAEPEAPAEPSEPIAYIEDFVAHVAGMFEIPQVDLTAREVYEAHPELTPVNYHSPALLPISEDAGEEYIAKISFICDSPTYWMWPFGLLSGGTDTNSIWTGPEGTMTLAYQSTYNILDPYDNIEKPIRQVVQEHQPEILILAVGINGISFMDEEYFKTEYTDLITDIQAVSPDTKIILQSIYPITPAYKHWGNITNVMITEANSWMLQLAEEHGCKYLDTFSVLVGEDGHAKPELMMRDGLHPNYDGLSLVVEYIRTHAWTE